MAVFNVQEAKSDLVRLLRRAADGEDIVITQDGEPVARLVSCGSVMPNQRIPGDLKGAILESPDC